jgi:hypothetical protein
MFLLCFNFCVLIRCIKFCKETNKCTWVYEMLLYSKHRYVVATCSGWCEYEFLFGIWLKQVSYTKTHSFCSSSSRSRLACWSAKLLRHLYCASRGCGKLGLFAVDFRANTQLRGSLGSIFLVTYTAQLLYKFSDHYTLQNAILFFIYQYNTADDVPWPKHVLLRYTALY